MRSLLALAGAVVITAGCPSSHATTRSDGGSTPSTLDSGRPVDADTSPPVDSGADATVSRECTHPTDCVLIPETCCGSCGAYTRTDAIALPRNAVDAHIADACAGPAACPECIMDPDPALIANCSPAGRCVVLDLYDPANDHRSEFTACERHEDCVIRTAECCECGASTQSIVAIHRDRRAELEAIVCAPGTGCDDCAPDYGPFFTWCGGDTPEMPARCRVDVVGP